MRDALSRLRGLLQASAHPETILVWGLPSAPQLSIMALEPPKPELQDFREGLSQLARFRSIEASVFAQGRRRNDMLLPVDEVYGVYGALLCDGLHFGSSWDRMTWGCLGFSVVSDLITQVLLNHACWGRDIGVC